MVGAKLFDPNEKSLRPFQQLFDEQEPVTGTKTGLNCCEENSCNLFSDSVDEPYND